MADTQYYQLSQAQRRIWLSQNIYPESTMFIIGGYTLIKGQVDISKLKHAIIQTVLSNDSFQIRVAKIEHQPVMYFNADHSVVIDKVDFSGEADPEKAWKIWLDSMTKVAIPLEHSALYQFYLIHIQDDLYSYMIKLHHIISDGWSAQNINQQIEKNYHNLMDRNLNEIEKPASFLHHVQSEQAYLQSALFDQHRMFWMEEFAGYTPVLRDKNSFQGKRWKYEIPAALTCAIKQFCKDHAITLNSLMTGVYILYCYLHHAENDCVIGLPVLGRENKAERTMMGMFVNTMAFRFKLDKRERLMDYLYKVQSHLRKCYRYRRYPYNQLLKDLNLGSQALYATSINCYHTTMPETFCGMPMETREFYNGQQEYDLQIIVREWNKENIQLSFDYRLEVYSQDQIQMMCDWILLLIEKTIAKPDKLICHMDLLSSAQKKHYVYDFNHTTKPASLHCDTVVSLFDQQVEKNSHTVAIYDQGKTVSYRKLKERSENLACHLLEIGMESGQNVGIIAEHSAEVVIGIVGVLRAGGVYVPIDPAWHAGRINDVIEDADIKFILTAGNVDVPRHIGRVNYIDLLQGYEYKHKEALKKISMDTAYILYTSGTSGRPKGVIVGHDNLVHYISWAKKTYLKRAQEIFPLFTSMAFDLTVTSIFTPLVSGGTVDIYRDDQDEYVLNRILKDNRATILKLTPSHLMLAKKDLAVNQSIHSLIVGGEDLKTSLAEEIDQISKQSVTIYNEYGPTETTVGCMIHQYRPEIDNDQSVSIGKPIDDTQIYILDQNLNPLPPETEGEIYIAGQGVTRGYWRQPELTNEKFISNPFIPESRMYRSGDLARRTASGNILFTGRMDQQVKIRGHRVELGEITAQIKCLPDVQDAISYCYEEENSASICVCYTSNGETNEQAARQWLQDHLPSYMVPTYLFPIDRIPINQNGKVDMAGLPRPKKQEKTGESTVALSIQQTAFLRIFQHVLGVPSLTMQDNFFHEGGDSIKAIQASADLREKGYSLRIQDILSYPVLEQMFFKLSVLQHIRTTIAPRNKRIPSTPIMKWFLSRRIEKPNWYCQGIVIRFRQLQDIHLLQRILKELIFHHDSLKINLDDNGTGFYYGDPKKSDFREIVQEKDISRSAFDEQSVFDELKMINLQKGIPVKSCLCHTGEEDIWCVSIHHCCVDGISWRIILEDIQTMLGQTANGQAITLPAKTSSFQEWAYYLETDNQPLVPTGNAQTDEKSMHGYCLKTQLAEVHYEDLKKANKSCGLKNIEVFLAALILAKSRVPDYADKPIIMEMHGRDTVNQAFDFTRTVGWFTRMGSMDILLENEDYESIIRLAKEKCRQNQTTYDLDLLKNWVYALPDDVIRFNYLGEFRDTYTLFSASPYSDPGMDIIYPLEIDMVIQQQKIHIMQRMRQCSGDSALNTLFFEQYQRALSEVIDYCLNKSEIILTPSDFAIQLSQEEFDGLFQ